MAKIKTIKSIKKRIILKKTGKVLKKKAGQSHFNARETGKIKKNKRQNQSLKNKKIVRSIKRFI